VIATVIFISLPMLAAVRPQIFSMPLYVLTLVALQQDAVWLPLAFVVWANLHGGWLLGLGAVVVRTLVAPTRRRVLVLTGCVLATLVTPYGFGLYRSIADALTRGWGDVLEWQPVWALAAGRDDVAGELRDQRHRAVHALDDHRVDPVEIGLQLPEQRVERWLRAVAVAIDTRHRRHGFSSLRAATKPAATGWRTSLTRPTASEHRMPRRVKCRTSTLSDTAPRSRAIPPYPNELP
jgi:hypothetical protein